ncbi:mitogen-activated protein kinase kinase kinase 2-like [Physella acuta]|uniref:mitogen-activated protein kinase kinase kinase 2-like n=1 Tax=Physella acuta TaxID=109671 RepID=UPI0027DD447D|nr:mitogen-activated protein kinase kinase kinase 2-like [Physella acuta]
MVDDMNIKLTDFGISEYIDEEGVATEIGTVRYMAPEVIYTEGGKIIKYTSRADIWSVGCTVIEMLTGKPPNSSLISAQALFRTSMGELRYQLPPTSSVYLREFLDKVLHREAKERPTADWLLKNDTFILGLQSRNGDEVL